MTPTLVHQLAALPAQPGVYLFKNNRGDILYIGKAKLLRSRVGSYFRGSDLQANKDLDPAKQQMVSRIAHLETIVTDTETEALILEANLIGQYRPPYNVVLTDDKYYLFIKITTGEEFPRVFPVRRLKRDKARYFGPYSSARSVRYTLQLLRRIFPYRAEKDTRHELILPHPLFKVSPQITANYQLNIKNIIRFLQGDRQQIISALRAGMQEAASAKQFERATIFRDQLQALERLEGYQKVYLPRPESFDAISVVTDGSRSAANVLSVRRGQLLQKNTFLLKHHRQTARADILRQFLLQYYREAQDIPPAIFTPEELFDTDTIAQWINQASPPVIANPSRGQKRQLIAMGNRNAEQLLAEENAAFEQDARLKNALVDIQRCLRLDQPPARIETYDISNIQGQHATGSMIVFVNGQSNKDKYRKFRIATQDTPDDYRMLQEVLRRRFSGRHLDWTMPDLLLIDGGKGQLNSVRKVLAELKIDVPAVSIAKREEILFFCEHGKIYEARLPFDADALYLIQRMRDEAHRFGVTYHRFLRSKRSQRSLLDEIPGLGPATKKRLLNHFGSLQKIRAAPNADLIKIIGPARTNSLRNFL